MGTGEVEFVGAEFASYTFLFTDVEGSTRRWEADPEEMAAALASHDRTLSATIEAHGGAVFKRTGDGVCAVFESAAEAVSAAVDAQRLLVLPVRMGIHAGGARQRDGDFFGTTVNRCARLMDSGHGGQVLISASAASLAADRRGSGFSVRDLGEHRLRDLNDSERIFQVVAPGLRDGFPVLRSLDDVRHNLPVVRSSFVGRRMELEWVCERLFAHHLVTLTGIGGCGKTRLALEASASLVEHFPQGVFFVDLAVVSDPGLVGQAVAGALGVQLLDTGIDGLAGYLTGRRVLLVPDNCEHLLGGCAELIGGLVARCPELHVLATSREALGLDAERTFRVPSLDPDTDAVSLFMDRALLARPDLRLDTAGERAVAEICRRLDGIPLAIELAAARIAHLAPAQILERLADRFRLLTGGRRRVRRQQTLAAAIDWSYRLLTEEEQMLLRRLAVFRGSFSLQAVDDICRPDALNLLGSLVARSLVGVQDAGSVVRYRLLETVRMYAENRLLTAGEAATLRNAHRDWFLAWIESVPVGELVAIGAGDQLAPEADNLAVALDWSREQGRLDYVARIASRMIGYWWSYVRVAEMAGWWRALQDILPSLPKDLRAAALLVGVQHANAIGDFETMETLSAQAVASAAPGSWVAAYAWSRQAMYWTYADPERGSRCIEEGRKAATAAGVAELDRTTAMWSANLLIGDPEHDQALGAGELIDGLLTSISEKPTPNSFAFVGLLAMLGDAEHVDYAARLAAELVPRTPWEHFSGELLNAVVGLIKHRSEVASRHLRLLATVVREYAIPLGDVSCLIGLAALAADDGHYERASRRLATARNAAPFPFRTPLEVLLYRRVITAVRGALDPDTVRRCRAQGTATSVRDAITEELARLPPLDASRQARAPTVGPAAG